MSNPGGRSIALSVPRRFIGDLVHFAHKIPSVPVERRMHLGALARARERLEPRPSWCTLFTKAYALVAERMPELRRAYMSWPRPHLYEHPTSVASIAVERQFDGEEGVFFGHIKSPAEIELAELDKRLRHLKVAPILEVGSFRQSIRLARMPWPVRRFVWWFGLNVWGRKRAHHLGTFGISVYASLGAASLHPLSPLTTTLNYGVLEADGSMDVRLVYDHRVLDGAVVARALGRLEDELRGRISAELLDYEARQAG
jgi:hypothetical protein